MSDEIKNPSSTMQQLPTSENAMSGYILDAEKLGPEKHLKTAEDGRTVLIPQPAEDRNDPLNWSPWKKHAILLMISFVSFLPDYGTAQGSVTQIPQAKMWHLPVTRIQETVAINTMLSGVSGIAVVALSNYFGRAPTFFWMRLIACAGTIWYAKAQTFHSFYSARILVGFFVGAGQSGGLMWVRDMFFLHQQPRKINIWSAFIISSPYFGPFVASFVVYKLSWHWVYWVYAILNFVGFFLMILFADETYYDRKLPQSQQPPWKSRALRLLGIEKHTHASVIESISRPFIAFTKIPVIIITLFYFLNFSWTIGVNATLATWLAKYYHFNAKETGFFYFAPLLGCLIGFTTGHWAHDFFARLYTRRNNGVMDPEARLYIIYGASLIAGAFILLLGQALEHKWHYMAVAVFDAAQLIGVNIISTAVNAYLGDAYSEAPGEVDTWIVIGRTMGGLMATYIELPWVERVGPASALGTQAGITWAALALIVLLQLFGKRIRQWQGPMVFPGSS